MFLVTHGLPQRFPEDVRTMSAARNDDTYEIQLNASDVALDRLVPIGASDQKPTVLVWGDSHAMSALPAVDAFLKERGLGGRAALHSSTAPVLDWYMSAKYGLNENAIPFSAAVLDYARARRLTDVILIGYWDSYLTSNENHDGSFAPALIKTVRNLAATGARVWVMQDVPNHAYNIPKVLALHLPDAPVLAANSVPGFDRYAPNLTADLQQAGGVILDPRPHLLDPTGRFYVVEDHGIVLYRDGQHMTTHGALHILLPLLREAWDRKR
jgi:hypothetical protein